MYVFGSGRDRRCCGREDWVWVLPILEEHGESGLCVCVLAAVVLGGVGDRLGPGSRRVGWCYICVCCESGLCVLMADTCAS